MTDTDKLEEISGAVSEKVSYNMEAVMKAVAAGSGDPSASAGSMPRDIEINGSVISPEDQLQTMEILGTLDQNDDEAVYEALTALPESVTDALYTDITIDGVTICRIRCTI